MHPLIRSAMLAAAAVLAGISLQACSTIDKPQLNAVHKSNIVDKVVAHSQFAGWSNEPLAQTAEVQHPRANGGVEPYEAHVEIGFLWWNCVYQLRPQLAGPKQSTTTGAVPQAGISAASVGLSVDLAFNPTEAVMKKYFVEGAVSGAIQGGYNNNLNGAIGSASTIGSCTRDLWNLSKAHDPTFMGNDAKKEKYWGTVVETVTAGKGLGSPPALEAAPNL